ncbi:MAG: prolipoprotein diacylglyceryl transferase [Candidatus Abawacabacteria bacterium]|nr:prolipoprotein diacylglyceryl transferase [Candidatus Abawacabacteria bacterium]
MYPILVSLGPIQFYSFGTLFVLGLLLSWVLIRYLIYFYRLQPTQFYYALPWAIVGGLVAARLGFVFTYTDRWRGGLWAALFPAHWWSEWAIWAGIWGALAALVIFWLKHNEPVFLWLDVLSIGIQPLFLFCSLGLFLSPVGLTADALGRPTTLPWGIIVDAVDLPFANVPVHPLLLYNVFFTLITFAVTWLARGWARTYVGRLFVMAATAYGFLWLWLGVVRWYSPRAFLGMDVFWLNGFLYLLIAIFCLIYIVRKHAITQKKKQMKAGL